MKRLLNEKVLNKAPCAFPYEAACKAAFEAHLCKAAYKTSYKALHKGLFEAPYEAP